MVTTTPDGVVTLQSIYQVSGLQSAHQAYDLLGVWGAVPQLPAGVAFMLPNETNGPVPCWRADYPDNLRQAGAYLSLGKRSVDASRSALSEVEARLESFVLSDASLAGAPSFGVPGQATAPQLRAEYELGELLRDLPGVTGQGVARQGVSFGLGDVPGGVWQHAFEAFRAATDWLTISVLYYAWVETRVGGKLLGRSVVTWKGDLNTVEHEGLTTQQQELHHETLALALSSRSMVLRMFVLATRGAVTLAKLPVLLSTPLGPLLAPIAIWRFISLAVAEITASRIGG